MLFFGYVMSFVTSYGSHFGWIDGKNRLTGPYLGKSSMTFRIVFPCFMDLEPITSSVLSSCPSVGKNGGMGHGVRDTMDQYED